MKYFVVKGDAAKLPTELLVLGRFDGQALDDAKLEEALKRRKFCSGMGKSEFFGAMAGRKAENVMVVGLGKPRERGVECYRVAAAAAVRRAKSLRASRMTILFPKEDSGAQATARWAQAVAEGCELGAHRFSKYLSEEDAPAPARVEIHYEGREGDVRGGIALGVRMAECATFAGDLVSEPAGYLTPTRMAEIAQREGRKAGLKVKVVDEREAKRLGMGCLVGVGQGSQNPPRLIHLSYRAAKASAPRFAILGKGITFDSGGLSLKPPKSMETMKDDMAGSAAVLATMLGVARLKPSVHVDGVMVMAENMPSGSAIRPGDVLRSMSGKTVEVANTDAEGRLVLCDGLTYLQKKVGARVIVDLATLTGACMVALGDKCAAVMSRDTDLQDAILRAAKLSGELIAPLPLIAEYRELLRSSVADIRNVSDASYGGAITAGLFLADFIEERTRWAHLDIAGPAFAPKDWPLSRAGGTGFGVRTLLSFLLDEECTGALKGHKG